MTRTTRQALLLLLTLTLGAVALAADGALRVFDAVWGEVGRSFYDPDLHGVDWDRVRDVYRPLVAAAGSELEVRGLLLGMLSELGASHTTIVDAEVHESMVAELLNRRAWTFGLVLEESLRGRYFVRAQYEGGPGEAAGLRVGDRIVEIDGVPFAESPFVVDAGYDPALPGPPLYFLRASSANPLLLKVQSDPDAESRREISVSRVRMNAVDAARNSVSIVEQDGVRVGTLHIWYCSRGVTKVLREAVTGPLAECDALVLDIRGRGGYSAVSRSIADVFREGPDGMLWSRPLVVLIDDRSRSAKELLAYRIRADGLGVLVGQRTEGAVLGAFFHALPDGSVLELPGMAVPVDGVSLEGVGVAPDLEVDLVIPYAGGVDTIFVKGCEAAAREVLLERRRVRGPF